MEVRIVNNPLLDEAELARGREIRRHVLGDKHVANSHAVDALSQPKTQLSEYVWSKIWRGRALRCSSEASPTSPC